VAQLKKILQWLIFCVFAGMASSCTDGAMTLISPLPTDSNSDGEMIETETPGTEDTAMETESVSDSATDNKMDSDSESEACPDPDSDGLCNDQDNCVAIANAAQDDFDSDGVGDICDPCPDVSDAAQAPWEGNVHAIPGLIELEFFDEGGQCVAYFDVDELHRGDTDPYREDEWLDAHGQQVETVGDYVVGFTYVGEWVEYTVNTTAGRCNIALRYSSEMAAADSEGTVDLRLDERLIGTFVFPDTGSFSVFADALIENVELPQREGGVLRLHFRTQYINYTRITFAALP
jgi:hypothetical protein